MNIHGKEYITVNERVTEFRKLHPDWTIASEILTHDNGMIVMVTKVSDESGRVIATGHAYEREGSTNVNKTSYIENCETSAVGRALAFLGIGIVESIASADEVKGAVSQRPSATRRQIAIAEMSNLSKQLTPEQKKKVVDRIKETGIERYQDATDEQMEAINNTVREMITKESQDNMFNKGDK